MIISVPRLSTRRELRSRAGSAQMDTRLWRVLLLLSFAFCGAQSDCNQNCDLALASYYIWENSNLTFISQVLSTTIDSILEFNKESISNKDLILSGSRVNVPFPCGCIENSFLGHNFSYVIKVGDFYDRIAETYYSRLTTTQMLQRFNSYDVNNLVPGSVLNVVVNCSCGNSSVSEDFGLFITYPLRGDDSLDEISAQINISSTLLQAYNPGANFSAGSGLVFIPGKDQNGAYPRLNSSTGGLGGGAIAGIVIAVVAAVLLLAVCFWKKIKHSRLATASQELTPLSPATAEHKSIEESRHGTGQAPLCTSIVDKSMEFSYEELARATNYFNLANKIGEGGFGSVYYAELRGEKAAIKKMDMQATKEFLAELQVLTRVHHSNLVRLIGYCVEGSLFLVYEFIENGNLSQHLRGSGRDVLPWSKRVQIALDSARGLEYIHEHTDRVYIHRDIKSANILINKNFRAKVADFGLTKLTEVGNTIRTQVMGTFGYMPPEYARYGEVSPKTDVYAFGVVLYELISAKEVIIKTNRAKAVDESKGLAALFEDVLNNPDPRENLRKLVDTRLGDNYPIESVLKMGQLAKACTSENSRLRPSTRSIVVALMTLSSSTEDWDVGSFLENQAIVNLMSGR